LDRDAGAQLRHHFKLGKNFLVREIFSVSQGEGLNQSGSSSGSDYTGRIELLPFGNFTKKGDYFSSDLKREETPKLMLSCTYDYNEKALRERGQKGDYIDNTDDIRSLQTFFADAHFKYQGLSFFGEYVYRTAVEGFEHTIPSVGTYYTGSSINLQLGYLLKNNWEFAGRFTQVTPEVNTGNNNINQYTLGFSRYVVGHNLKVQGDISLTQETTQEPVIMFRLQTEFNF
jgi:hypothetical protein